MEAELRRLVRESLSLAPGYWYSDMMLCRAVNNMLPRESKESEILEACAWNLSKGFVDTRVSEDTDEREWKITKDGIAKDNV